MSERAVETRILRWTQAGYEDSYTQYQIFPHGDVWITQFALRDNLARKLGSSPPSRHPCLTVENAREWVDRLVQNRAEHTEEVGV